MQVYIGETVVAEAAENQLVQIEGNLYFPPDAINWALFQDSSTPYTCPWKGEAAYWTVRTPAESHVDVAWSYPTPAATAIEHVGRDFSGYVAFDRVQVQLLESRTDLGIL